MTLLKKHASAIVAVSFFLIVLKLLNTSCPFLYITGEKCPACGSTRAIKALLKGDVQGYLAYNIFAVPLAISLFCMLHIKMFRHKKTVEAICIVVVAATVIKWIYVNF